MPVRKKKAVKHTRKEKAHLRAVQRRSGPSAVRRRERRLHLQPKPFTEDEIINGVPGGDVPQGVLTNPAVKS